MSTISSNVKKSAPGFSHSPNGWLKGVLVGLIPLGALAGILVLTVAGGALARLLFVGSGFFAQQEAILIVMIVGSILAIAAFALAVWRVLRRVALWQQSTAREQARAALWALGATALLIVLPILLAFLLPQHPAP